jgi:fatty acid desaturase
LENISDKPIRIQLPNDSTKDTKELVLVTSPKYYFVRISFMPVVHIEMQEKENTEVSVRFELHRGVKAFLTLWSVALLLFFAILLVGFLIGQVAFTPIIFMPFVMILFGYALSIVRLYGSSQYVSRVLFKELPYRQGKLPKIQLQK